MAHLNPFENMSKETIKAGIEADIDSRFEIKDFKMRKPILSIIVAMANNKVIGKDNDMPWGRLPVDLKHFKDTTNGSPIIMGRKTYESIGRPLPNRLNILVSRNKDLKIDGVNVVQSIEEGLDIAENFKEVFIIGGGELYKQSINLANKFYFTFIDFETDGDTFFPDFEHINMKEISNIKILAEDKNKYDCNFVEMEVIT